MNNACCPFVNLRSRCSEFTLIHYAASTAGLWTVSEVVSGLGRVARRALSSAKCLPVVAWSSGSTNIHDDLQKIVLCLVERRQLNADLSMILRKTHNSHIDIVHDCCWRVMYSKSKECFLATAVVYSYLI